MAGSGLRSKFNRDRNSPAICWASAALPPLPAISNLCPARNASVMVSAMAWMVARKSASSAARDSVSQDRRKCSATKSFCARNPYSADLG